MADAAEMPPRLIALADQLQAQVAGDARRTRRNMENFADGLERAKAMLAEYAELPMDACIAAVKGAFAELEAERTVIHDSRIETEGEDG